MPNRQSFNLALTLLVSSCFLGCSSSSDGPTELEGDDQLGVETAALTTSFNGMRVAFAPQPVHNFVSGVPAGFDEWLAKAQSEFYTHVSMVMDPGPWTDFKKVEDLQVPLQNAIRAINARGMKALPLVSVGSASSGWWKRLKDPSVEMNRVEMPNNPNWVIESPTYAENLDMDKQFSRLIYTIRAAATLTPGAAPVVDAVTLSYDEFAVPYSAAADHFIIAGGGPPGGATKTLSFSQADRDFIRYRQDLGLLPEQRFAALINTSLHRRMKTVQSVLGAGTKVLVYGDEWDPQATGGYRYHTYQSATDWVYISPHLRSLQGLNLTQKAEVKQGVIFVPWNYSLAGWPKAGAGSDVDTEPRYDAFAALSAFNQAGLKFIYGAGYATDVPCEGKAAMQNYVRASRWFPNTSVGYMATWWSLGVDNPPINCADPVPNPLEIRHDLYVANANMPPTLKECPLHFEDHWFYGLTSSSVPWNKVFGDPSINTSTNRLVLSYDDVVRRSPMDLGYTLTFNVTFNGDMAVHPDVGIANLTTNYPALRRVGGKLQVGGLRYGSSNTWGSAGAFTGQTVTTNTAKVTIYVASTAKMIAMRVDAGGSVFKSNFIQLPNFDPKVVQLVGGNNSGAGASSSTLTPIIGCGGIDDTWVGSLYNQ